jgi:hypothetical protein
MADLLKPLIQKGKITRGLPSPQDIRSHVLEQLTGEKA